MLDKTSFNKDRSGHLQLCVCGHTLSMHAHGKDCLVLTYPVTGHYCTCKEFRRADSQPKSMASGASAVKNKQQRRNP